MNAEELIVRMIAQIIEHIDKLRDYIILLIAIFQIIIITYLLRGGWSKLSKSCSKEDVENIIDRKFGIKLNELELKISYIVDGQKEIKTALDKVIFKNFN